MTRARDTSINGSGGANVAGSSNVTLATLQPFLTTANVKESGGNLYYSNSRTFSNVQLASIDDLLDVNVKISGNVFATAGQALVWNGSFWIPGSVTSNSSSIVGSVSPFLTTANVVELGNLYYTNARARTAFTAGDPTITIDWLTGTIRANVTAIANASSTTDAVLEGFNNKYYTNARVREFLSQSNLQIMGDINYPGGDKGLISLGQTLVWGNTGTRLAFIPGSPTVTSTDFANNAEIANVVRSIANFTTANLTEFGNLYFTNPRVVANVANLSIDALFDVWTPANLKISNYVLTWDGQNWMPAPSGGSGTTAIANVALIANFANIAGVANVALIANYANVSGRTNQANTSLYANVAGIANQAITSYFANTAYFADTATFATTSGFAANANYANVSGRTNQANTSLYANVAGSTLYANVAGIANSANTSLFANVANTAIFAILAGQVSTLNNFTTSNLAEGVNLYFTNTRVADSIQTAIYGKDITLDDLNLKGTLTVEGNTTLLYSTNNFITGKQIQLAYLAGSAAASEGAGLFIPGANASFLYGQTNDGFGLNKDLTILGNIIPAIGGRFSLGTQAKPFRDLFLGTQTLYVGNTQVGSGASGGLQITDQFGNPAGIALSNVSATQYVTVDRLLGNVFPLTEFKGYIGGNVLQFLSNTTGNLYLGILKDGDYNKFAGLRVVETRDNPGNVRSDLYFYTDREGVSNSIARLGLLGTGNVTFNGNTISINGTDIISNLGDFVGNAYYGSRPIDTRYGGTGGANTTVGRDNLFGDLPGTGGIVTKLKTTNALSSFAIVESTGVSVAGGDGQSGNIIISIGQNVSTIASVTFRDLTLTGNLYVFGNAATVYSNTLIVNDPMFQIGYGNPSDNFDLGFIGHYKTDVERHAGFFRDHTDGTFKVFDNLTSEPGLNDIDTANVTFRLANIAFNTATGNLTGYVSTLNNHTTAALREGANNLYYTDARVNTAVRPMLTTANVIETSGNLYFTNARVFAAVTTLTTANISEASSNLYFTNARVISALIDSTIPGNLTITGRLSANSLTIQGIDVTNNVTANNVSAGSFTGNSLIVDNITANISVNTSNLTVTGSIFARANTRLTLGNTIVGSLVSNAVTLTTETSVTDSITQLNQVLGKLVPSRPPSMGPTNSIAVQTVSSYRMTTVTQTDRTSSSRTVPAGSTVALVRRASTYQTNTIANVGLGDNGTVSVIKNGVDAGSRALTTSNDGGVYGDLTIINNVDYATITGQASGFWESFRANATGTVSGGWNEVYINHTTGGSTPAAYWYYDATTVAAPQFTNLRIGPTSNVYSNSSTVPHFTNATNFMLQFDVNRLSGDMFPTSNTFITGSSGGAFLTPTSVTYASANVSFPLAPNLYVASGSLSTTTNVAVTSGFGVSAGNCTLTADNSYNTGSGTFAPVANVLYKTGTGSAMEETNHTFSSTVGTGSGLAARIENPGSTDNPVYTANAFLFNPQTSTLNTYDATIVGAVLKHDQINYSTGYLPVGPNLSAGRSGAQYYTFRFVRTSVSKFDIQFSGTIAGMWVALPGSTIDSTSSLNGWLDMSISAVTSGIPGANTGAGGNGSNGCALGGPVTLNSLVSSHRKTCTFGTVSSSSTATNEIYVRIKLTAGQTVSALTLQTASN